MTKFIIGDISTFPVTSDPAEITGSLEITGSSANPRLHILAHSSGGPAIRATGSVEIAGDLTVTGTTTTVTTDNTLVKDKLITLNDGGGSTSGGGAGIEIEENSSITGYVKTSSDRAKWEFKVPTGNTLSITPSVTGKTISLHDDTALNQNLRTTDSPQFAAVGIGTDSPGAPTHIYKAATTATTPLETLRLEVADEGVDMNIGGGGPGIDFYVGETGGSNYGGTVAVIREEASDVNSDAAMVFHTTTDDQGPGNDREKMRITSDGKVGIGTTSPDNPLEILSSTTPQMRLTHTDATDYATFSVDGDGQLDITTADGGGTGGHICLMPDGYVGIGTGSPTDLLTVAADLASGTNAGIHIAADGDDDAYLDLTEQGGSSLAAFGATDAYGFRVVYDGGAGVEALQIKSGDEATVSTRMTIKRSTGNVGIGTTDPNTALHVSSSVTDAAALTVDGGVVYKYTAKDTSAASVTYTILESDYLIGCDTSTHASRTIALTLPTAASCQAGQQFVVKDEGGDGGVANTKITIGTNPLGSETLDGAAPSSTGNPLDPGTPYFAATFYTDGSNWFIY